VLKLIDSQRALLTLLSQALWGNGGILSEADWESVEEMAKDQGVLPLLYRGAIKYKDIIPTERIRIWRGTMYAAVLQNDHMLKAQSEILEWLWEKNIRSVILKGSSVARYYEPSDMRYLGDIDLLIDHDTLEQVSDILREHGYQAKEHEHDFHVAFVRDDVTVEVHYEASVVPGGKGGQAARKLMSHFLDEATSVSMNEVSFPALSEKHQALMLLMHKERHVIAGGIGLRQLCDWAAFVGKQKDHDSFLTMYTDCGLLLFAKVVSKACVRYLGLDSKNASWCMDVDDDLVDALMVDVFRSGNMGKADQEKDGSLFAGRSMLDDHGQNAVVGLIVNLNKLANKHFPITIRCKWLLPVFWVYLPLRYIVRSMFGLRKKKNVIRMLQQSNKRFDLHKKLHLYEVK